MEWYMVLLLSVAAAAAFLGVLVALLFLTAWATRGRLARSQGRGRIGHHDRW